MKLKFNPNLEYQKEAVKAVTDLFKGQNAMKQYFSVIDQLTFDGMQGVGNKLNITNDDILENLRKVQSLHKLAPSESLKSLDFNIEMETGTGKTYVYLKTIFELNKLYGFTKFIIAVPSVAIKEGVYKTIKITKEHFKSLYDNVIFNYFVYNRDNLGQVRNFSLSSNIDIMIINIGSFNSKDTNVIHKEMDELSGYKPIELIQETNPIIIIDEPQSVVGTANSEEAISSLNPLCTLRYSATHKEIQNLIYKLDAVDAYEKDLVKQIEVASITNDSHNKSYMKLVSTNNKKSPITAEVEIDVMDKGSINRKIVTVKKGSDLSEKNLSNRKIYEGYIVDEIYCEEGNEYVSFTSKDEILRKNVPIGDIDDLEIKRIQIRKTIEEHLNKEIELNHKCIKVLSLFFIDKVSNYRQYDNEGNPVKGIYAQIFEEEYQKVIKKPKYNTLTKDIDLSLTAEEVHNGYFSIDNKGKVKDTRETKKGKLQSNKDDESTFNLIMKDKEKLLSFDSKLKFIFSHSALREGWDNPNVFQICTLNETSSTMKKRQEIGRGLRLCVNQDGTRIKDKNINILTIMANESYESFAKSLQKEMETEYGIKFGIIEIDTFAHIIMKDRHGEEKPIKKQGSQLIYNFFKKMHYINGKGKVQDALKVAVDEKNVEVPEKYEIIKDEIVQIVESRTKKLPVKDASKKRKLKVNKQVYLSEDFRNFWDKIKNKTTYSVDFDTNELINNCTKALDENMDIKPPKFIYTKSGLTIDSSGVNAEEGTISTEYSDKDEIALPDIITFLQNETYLTRKTIVDILIKTKTINQFKTNPQEYMQEAQKIITKEMNSMLIDGIKYTKINDYYAQELFEEDELYGYLEKNMIKSKHSVYDHIIYDSKVEEKFAQKLEEDKEVKVYAKLPYWFKINTPLGGYNPDWAILLEKNGEQKMYFVIETKGNTDTNTLRPNETNKIKCGKKHFEALNNNINFKKADSYHNFKSSI
ncbi:MAG: DEAD/DEAH box helicase family protein [Methanobacteriaceae archaeon]|nr:DEAD/DEAH box helicase family protein [Methanobacteriaceae archaeon]